MTQTESSLLLESRLSEYDSLIQQYETACKAEIIALDELKWARAETTDCCLLGFLFQETILASNLVKKVEGRLDSFMTLMNNLR